MLRDKIICIIGRGNLGKAIAEGLVDSHKVPANLIRITRRRVEKLSALKKLGVQTGSDNQKAARGADIIIFAVKPYDMEKVVTEVSGIMHEDQILVSLATGITLEQLHNWSAHTDKIFRAMPNTATAVRESITCICGEKGHEEQEAQVHELFRSIGESVTIRESLMEAATVLGACGIAYVLRFIRAMIQGGIEIGFDAQTATLIASHTVNGATNLLIENKQHPEAEIDKVTTPKGCTIAGLNEMEHQGFSSSLIKGILTSYRMIEKDA
jgi:pyrroline-5-carboxylate reductase